MGYVSTQMRGDPMSTRWTGLSQVWQPPRTARHGSDLAARLRPRLKVALNLNAITFYRVFFVRCSRKITKMCKDAPGKRACGCGHTVPGRQVENKNATDVKKRMLVTE